MPEMPTVSSQSAENRLNGNEGKLFRVKLNSAQYGRKMHTSEEGRGGLYSIQFCLYYDYYTRLPFKSCFPQLADVFKYTRTTLLLKC